MKYPGLAKEVIPMPPLLFTLPTILKSELSLLLLL